MGSKPRGVRIRNQRYGSWLEIVMFMLIGIAVFGVVGAFFDKHMLYFTVAGVFGLVPAIVYWLFVCWDLRRTAPAQPVTARTLFEWWVLGIRRKELGPADGTAALSALRPLVPSVCTVDQLKLGDDLEVAGGILRFPLTAVKRIRFAPDPLEDYGGAESPLEMCQASVEMDSGKEFRLIVTEVDAEKMRQWAATKGIAVCDCDGYRPRPVEPAAEA